MDRERFAELERRFAELCDAPGERRRAAVAQLRLESPELAEALERMLARDGRPDSTRLDALELGLGRVAVAAVAQAEPPPESIGDFKILELLGAGGMGAVYRAEQQSPRRAVALKLLRPGTASPASLRRFELEAQLLGRLQHPGIAQIFDAGTATIGGRLQPWFAMELVDGVPLTTFVRGRGRRETIALLARVAEAVHHAHQKGIIHRDLKPANVLVTRAGEPKILDFGVARETGREPGTTTLATQFGQMLGTLAYMSPEQLAGPSDAIDTRCDVYALGVVAYEALAGRMPHELDGKSVPDAARTIMEVEPPRLGQLDPSLRGDLETIVAKAIEKEPARRYASAFELAADLRRHLDDQPIAARPPGAAYQLQKFARRHRGLVAGVSVASIALVVALVAVSVFAVRARERERTAAAVARVLDGLLTASDPWATEFAGARDVRVIDALVRAESGLDATFGGDRAVEASVRSTLGRTYLNLGELARARPHLEAALALLRQLNGPDDRDTLRTAIDVAALHLQQGDLADAEAGARAALQGCERALGAGDAVTLDAAGVLAHVLQLGDRFSEAMELVTRSHAAAIAAHGPLDPAAMRAEHNLAAMQIKSGDVRGAEARLRELIERKRTVHGDDHPLTLQSLGLLGEALWRQGRAGDAEPIVRQVNAARHRILGDEHTVTLHSDHGLASVLASLGRFDEALALRDAQLAVARRTLGPEHPLTLEWIGARALLLHKMQRLPEAEASCRALIEVQRRVAPDELSDSLNLLATLLVDQGRPADALPYFEEAVDGTPLPERHWRRALYRVNYGNCLRLVGRLDDAEPELTAGCEDLEAVLGVEHADTQYALAKLLLLVEAKGETERVGELRQRLAPPGRIRAR